MQQRIKALLSHPTIRRFLSGFLLVLFAFSVTPKILLHTLVVHHKDIPVSISDFKGQVSKSGFRCNVENTVAESPFEYSGNPVPAIVNPVYFLTHRYTIIPVYHSETGYVKGFRGPPQV